MEVILKVLLVKKKMDVSGPTGKRERTKLNICEIEESWCVPEAFGKRV